MTVLLSTACAFLVGGSSAAAYVAVRSGGGRLGRALLRYERRIDRHASFLLLSFSGRHIARVQVFVFCVCSSLGLVTGSFAFGALALLAAFGAPFVLWKRRVARVSRLEHQLDAWLSMLANALKASSSVGEAIASTVSLVPRPFSEEVDLIVKELRLGVSLDRALNQSAKRIGSASVSGALMMIVVARQTGGDLGETLESAAAALRETARLEGVLRTKTAEGRGQVAVLSFAPFVLCLAIAWLDRSWFDPLIHQPYGRAILAGCGSAWLMAAVWAHHIVGAKV
jgi:tight adherence protein B